MKHIKFEGTTPNILTPKKRNTIEKVYETPAADFELSRFDLEKGQSATFVSSSADILFIHIGSVDVRSEETVLNLKSGEAVVTCSGAQTELLARSSASAYRASVPVRKK
jgi:mannose-6-phosphate isomerase